MTSLTPVRTYSRRKIVSPPKLQIDEEEKENTENGWADSSQELSSQDDVNGSIDDFFLFDIEKRKLVKDEIKVKSDKRSIKPSSQPPLKKHKKNSPRMTSRTMKNLPSIMSDRTTLELSDQGNTSMMEDELRFLLEGLAVKKPVTARQKSAFNLVKLCQSEPLQVGQMLRSMDKFDSLIELLGQTSPSPSSPTHVMDSDLALAASSVLYYLVQEPQNTEYVTLQSIQLILTLCLYEDKEEKSDMKDKLLKLLGREREKGATSSLCMDSLSYIVSRLTGDRLNLLRSRIYSLKIIDRVVQLIEKSVNELKQCKEETGSLHYECEKLKMLFNLIDHVTYGEEGGKIIGKTLLGSILQHMDIVSEIIFEGEESHESIWSSLSAAQRAIINLTNNNSEISHLFTQLEGVPLLLKFLNNFPTQKDEHVFDVYIQTLALFINVVECHEHCQEAMQSPSHTLEYLYQIYQDRVVDGRVFAFEKSETEGNILASYINLLLALLCQEERCKEVMRHILSTDQIINIINVIQEFIMYQKAAGVLSPDVLHSLVNVIRGLNQSYIKQ
ncbi:hypothetical protein PROFUN_07566 [Planoprotostelium fungivorum]|uniref:Wings apart-like protein C-terminal domain-containing protein n=1 Tax=Planoprotostelium fungivorum TaxID=1890364 RepID=A0A2P6NLW4_9EUKA|nr:hypothetical protein PROFUN_07566 [Planoprotostelium fungivorum]